MSPGLGLGPKLTDQFEGDCSQNLQKPLAHLTELWTEVELSFRRRGRGGFDPGRSLFVFRSQLVSPLEQMSTMIHADQTDVQLELVSLGASASTRRTCVR